MKRSESVWGLSLVWLGLLLPRWLWAVKVDASPIGEPFNSLVFYAVDALALAWVVWVWLRRSQRNLKSGVGSVLGTLPTPDWPVRWLAGVALLAAISSAWAVQPALAWVTALDWALAAGLAWAAAASGVDWRALLPAAALSGLGELALSVAQIRSASTLVGRWLQHWPFELTLPGDYISVVGSASGALVMRAYGTLAHPNHLGGALAVMCLLLAGGLGLAASRPARLALALSLGLGVLALGLTFSRGAWLGGGLALAYLLVCLARAQPARALWVGLVVLTAAGLFGLRYSAWIRERVQPSESRFERISIRDRLALADTAQALIQQRPLTGVGAGNYLQGVLAYTTPRGPLAPAHNFSLLAWGELGLGGLLLALGLYALVLARVWQARRDPARAIGWLLPLAYLVANAFDVYAWSLQPSRLWLALLLGLAAAERTSGSANQALSPKNASSET